jgi:hypothetical protein
MKLFLKVIIGVLLLTGIQSVSAQEISQSSFWGKLAWDTAIGEGDNRFRYGNWYGPGWWGGSELDNRAGALAPVDALDAVAQKHDFGYELAEKLGKHDPKLEAHYKAIADAIAVRDTLSLPDDPRKWNPPAKDAQLARKYRERIALGFPHYQERLNKLKSVMPVPPDITDPEVLNAVLDQKPGDTSIVSPQTFENLVRTRVKQWNKAYKKRQNKKAADKGDAIDRASKSTAAKKNLKTAGMICSCEDWNKDGDFGVVIGDEIISANYGPYDKCMEFARELPVCKSSKGVSKAKPPVTAKKPIQKKPMLCTCEDWNRDGAFGVVKGKEIVAANYGAYPECMKYAQGLAVCQGK